jgi:hypothetical protein
MRVIVLVSIPCLALAARKVQAQNPPEIPYVLTWDANNGYSDTFIVNDIPYKVIHTLDERGSGFKIMIGASAGRDMNRDGKCLSVGRQCTTIWMVVYNEGSVPFDLNTDK